jgi:transketolase
MNLNVTIVGLGRGFSFSYDGPTHHATQDIAIMRTLPEIHILNPCDENTAKNAAKFCYNSENPTFVRIDKGVFDTVYYDCECEDGIKEITSSSRVKIITTGFMTHKAIEICDELKKLNLQVDVVDLYYLKPLPQQKVVNIIGNSDIIFTLEENSIIGGIGTMISEITIDNNLNTKIKRLALKDEQVLDYGDRDWLIEKNNLDNESICGIIKEEVESEKNKY